MKNFARLLRFSWPYRARFGLSVLCAMVVACLWGGNLGAVYPLLQVLFRNQNTQAWVIDQIETTETERQVISARLDESAFILAHKPDVDAIRRRGNALRDRIDEEGRRIRSLRLQLADTSNSQTPAAGLPTEARVPEKESRPLKVAEARLDELGHAYQLAVRSPGAFESRRERWEKELSKTSWWLERYRNARPWVERYLPDDGFRTLLLLIGLVMGSVAIKGVFLFLQDLLVADMTQLSLFDIRNTFFRRTVALDMACFNEQGSADLLARFTNDIESLAQGFNIVLGRVIREPLRIVTCLGGALWFNWRLTLLALILVPISAATTVKAGRVMKRAVRRSLESVSNIYKILQENLHGIKVVKAYTMERYERRRFFIETKNLYKKSVRVAKIDAMSDPVLELLALSTVVIALLSGSYLVLRHSTTIDFGFFKMQLAAEPMAIEDLLTLYAMLAGISDPIRKLANVHSKIQRASAASDRICALMDREPRLKDAPRAVPLPRHRKAIEFENVSFSYNGKDPVLKDVSLHVRHGEVIALVGPNGSGKSTLMNLLPRFWDVDHGSIRIDGLDLRDVPMRDIRSQIGMVIQETVLFRDTAANNIAYGSPRASREQVVEAAKRAYAHQFISQLPEGYDTVFGENGLGLSGGQRQRIALARAILRDPAILILDEATSAIDIRDEALIRKALQEFVKGRTTFLITHGMGTLEIADRIVLLNEGRIEAVGSEAELRRSSTLFRRLHEIHFRHRESA